MVDQTVKLALLTTRPQISVIPRFCAVSFRTNTGAAFGLFQSSPTALPLQEVLVPSMRSDLWPGRDIELFMIFIGQIHADAFSS